MSPETKQKLIAKRKEVTEKLIAQGVDKQQARFMVMSAGLKLEGLLEDQPSGDDGIDQELVEISAQARRETPSISRDTRTDAQVRADTADGIARDLHRERWCQ